MVALIACQNKDEYAITNWMMNNVSVLQKKKKSVLDEDDSDSDEDDPCEIKSIAYNMTKLGNAESISSMKDTTLNEETMKEVQTLVWSIGTGLDMRSGSHCVVGGIDGSLSHVGNRISISYIFEDSRGIGIDFGGGTGLTALTYARLTNYFMYSVEVYNLCTLALFSLS